MAKRKKRKSVPKKPAKQEKFSFFRFLFAFKAEIILLICLIAGVKIITALGIKKEPQEEDVHSSVMAISEEQHASWKKKYFSGYKIFAVTQGRLLHTPHDTLPHELKIDWKKVKVAIVPANPLTQTEEKIKINVPVKSYAPAGVYDLDVSAAILRHKPEAVGLTSLGWHSLIFEVIEDEGGYLLCLIGFQ